MKVSVEDKEGLFKSLTVEVEGELVSSALNDVYNYLKQNAEVEGFRKGKAPLWVIKARFKDYIKEEVCKHVANATLQNAISESGLLPVADIFLESVELEESAKKVSYKVSFEVPPQFELKLVEGLEVEVEKIEFGEDMLKERIEEIREEHGVWEPVEREIREGDLVAVSYRIEEHGTGEVAEGENQAIIGERAFRKEIEEALIGKKEGESVTLDDITLFDLSGKPIGKAKVELTVKSVKAKVLPELNNDFAKELGLGESWAEAEEKIKEEVKAEVEKMRRDAIYSAVAKKLLEIHSFDVPKTLLRRELTDLVNYRANRLMEMGIDRKYIDYKALVEGSMSEASNNIRIRLILDKYAAEKDIQVTPEDIEKGILAQAQRQGKSVEEVRELLQRENLMPVLEGDLRRQKALKDIISKVVIKEVERQKEEKDENT
ncbi:MAG: trigger factor [Aquificaceae bacterium]|nr:trigger factor [Aquificaceae bacterium]